MRCLLLPSIQTVAAMDRGLTILLCILLVLSRVVSHRLNVASGNSIRWQGAPFAISAFFDFLVDGRHLSSLLLLVVDLHHIDAS